MKLSTNSRQNDAQDGAFGISTIIMAGEDGLISGDKIADLFDLSRKTGKTFTELAQTPIMAQKRGMTANA